MKGGCRTFYIPRDDASTEFLAKFAETVFVASTPPREVTPIRAAGSANVNVVPWPGSLATHMRAPCSATMRSAISSPSPPFPRVDLWRNGESRSNNPGKNAAVVVSAKFAEIYTGTLVAKGSFSLKGMSGMHELFPLG